MASSIQAFLMVQGHAVTLGSTASLTEVWLSCNLRPDLAPTYLPELGDNPKSENVISDQSTIAGGLASLFCKSITEGEYLEGDVRGTVYTVQYDNTPADWSMEPTNDPYAVILSISSAAQVDTWSRDPSSANSPKIYIKSGSSFIEKPNLTISKITALTNVSTTRRYRSVSMAEIIALGTLNGSVNAASMWGQGAGCIYYGGIQASPVQEIRNSAKQINWNVTNTYQIKYIPGVGADTWDYVFADGGYSKLYSAASDGSARQLYTRASIPNDFIT